ncbi:hypothetical protein [Terracidiphilus sp.]|jgi:uncharacterized protein|uniref:hypothetical protein n=1 Tax=Terracidiphilus sp. TaxID=1964191 RepID=UPI003C298D13
MLSSSPPRLATRRQFIRGAGLLGLASTSTNAQLLLNASRFASDAHPSWFNNSISVERGPLVFSYGVGESWVKLRDRGMTADWQVFPANAWNYALSVDTDSPGKNITTTETEIGEIPFTRHHAPVQIHIQARRFNEWRAEDGVAPAVPPSPVQTNEPEETITLIPYAAAKLRITAFPQSI